jgi:hypothetical protein
LRLRIVVRIDEKHFFSFWANTPTLILAEIVIFSNFLAAFAKCLSIGFQWKSETGYLNCQKLT